MTFAEFQNTARKEGNRWLYDFPDPPFPAVIWEERGEYVTEVGTYAGYPFVYVEWILFGYLTGVLDIPDGEEEENSLNGHST